MKILVLYNNLFHYRVPIFEILSQKYDLTVAYTFGKSTDQKVGFTILKLEAYKINRFVIHKANIYKICKNYDVVVVYGDIAWIKYVFLPFYKGRKFKVIFWSPGVSASYKKKFDEITKWDKFRDFFYRRADALIFYSSYPIEKYLRRGFVASKLFVAPNTVSIESSTKQGDYEKNSFLFIGSLYLEKGILDLLENYKLAINENPNIYHLNIVGGGKEMTKLIYWIKINNLKDKVYVKGPIFDVRDKSEYFFSAIACISPRQAGLSVLESMGFGVPYVTTFDALTGGERLNIVNGVNGVLMRDTSELKQLFLDMFYDKNKYLKMGVKAKEYYDNCRKPSHMANGICSAINYVVDLNDRP